MEEEEEEDQREMARTKETKRMEPSAETDKSHLRTRDTRNALADRRTDDLVTHGLWFAFAGKIATTMQIYKVAVVQRFRDEIKTKSANMQSRVGTKLKNDSV